MSKRNKDLEAVVREALDRGWEVIRFTGRHRVLRHPSGRLYSISWTPSDRRAVANTRTALRRIEREAQP